MMITQRETGRRAIFAASGAAAWLSLAPTPAFALMAFLASATSGGADMMCRTMHEMSLLNGMVPMYVLMSLFHSGPWLKRIARLAVI